MIKKTLLVLVFVFFSACTSWPPTDTGGYAQHYIFSSYYASKINPHDRHYFIYQRLSCAQQKLLHLRTQKMAQCYPAYLSLLSKDVDFAAQQFASSHFQMSFQCVQKLEKNIANLGNLVKKKRCQRAVPMFDQYSRNTCDQ